MEQPWWMEILREQRAAQFADFAGSDGSVSIAVADRLLSRVIASRLGPSMPVARLDLEALAGNEIAVRIKLVRPSFLPAFTIRLVVHRQPQLPSSPDLVLRIVSQRTAALAGLAALFVQALPPGVRLEGDLLYLNLVSLLERYGAGELLAYLTDLQVSATDGQVVFTARAAIGPAAPETN
jgi:hypothetical protein